MKRAPFNYTLLFRYVFDGKPPEMKREELKKRFSVGCSLSNFSSISYSTDLFATFRSSRREDASEELAAAIEVKIDSFFPLIFHLLTLFAFNFHQSGNQEDIEKFSKRTVRVSISSVLGSPFRACLDLLLNSRQQNNTVKTAKNYSG